MPVRPRSSKPDRSVLRARRPWSTKSSLGACLPYSRLKSKHLSAWNVISRIVNLACSGSPFGVRSPIIIHQGASAPTGR